MTTYSYFETDADKGIAYIRPVDRATLPAEVREQTSGMENIFAIHAASGEVLALVDDRQRAFALAEMHDMHLLSVH